MSLSPTTLARIRTALAAAAEDKPELAPTRSTTVTEAEAGKAGAALDKAGRGASQGDQVRAVVRALGMRIEGE